MLAFARSCLALLVVCASVSPVFAQAWVPPARVGAVTLVFQNVDNTGHRLHDGSLFPPGYDSVSRAFLFNFDYAVTDRFSFAVEVPYLGTKYTGPNPSISQLPLDDCFCWNHGWQDWGATARYNLANGAFALTPSISLGVPTHDYGYFGEAVLGRNLKEMRIGVDVGQRLDPISPRLSVSGRYSYAFVEKAADISNNRSNMGVESGFQVTRKLGASLGFRWQRTHGGLRSTEFVSDELFEQYDRIIKDNNFHISAGVSYSFSRVDVFASYLHYATGTDTHLGRAITTGVSFPFER
jgi:hypothetical protein